MIDKSFLRSNADCVEFYGDMAEEDPPRMPEPLGEPVSKSAFVESDHDSNVITRRSHTGILLFVWNCPIKTFSKRQNTVQ